MATTLPTTIKSNDIIPEPIHIVASSGGSELKLVRIPTDGIYIPPQARKIIDEAFIACLAEAMRDKGQTWPIKVRRGTTSLPWDLVAGEQRLRAARQAGFTEVWALEVQGDFPEADILEDQLQENGLRTSLRPCEEAEGMDHLFQLRGYKTITELAQALRFPLTHVSRRLKLLKSYPPEYRTRIDEGAVAELVALEIAKLRSEQERLALFDRAEREGWTKERAIAQVSALIRRRKPRSSLARPVKRAPLPLPGGATITLTCPDGLPELTSEVAFCALEFAAQEAGKAIAKANKKKIPLPLSELRAHFEQICKKAREKAAANGKAATDDEHSVVLHRENDCDEESPES